MTSKVTRFQGEHICWVLKSGNIIDEPVDVLVCSANVSLNLSGGVGADLLGRYGVKMQRDLHRIIAGRSPKMAHPGEVVAYTGKDIPYKAVLHAVAVDGWYHSSPELVRQVAHSAFEMAATFGARTVALTALATGFGDLPLSGFGGAIRPLLNADFPPIGEVCIALMEDYRLSELADSLFGKE